MATSREKRRGEPKLRSVDQRKLGTCRRGEERSLASHHSPIVGDNDTKSQPDAERSPETRLAREKCSRFAPIDAIEHRAKARRSRISESMRITTLAIINLRSAISSISSISTRRAFHFPRSSGHVATGTRVPAENERQTFDNRQVSNRGGVPPDSREFVRHRSGTRSRRSFITRRDAAAIAFNGSLS
jgi:hypothetical protein